MRVGGFASACCLLGACAGAAEAPAPTPAASASQGPPAASAAPSAAVPADMVLVPAGPFLRGSPKGVGLDDERPQREIALKAFLLDRTEVTQKAYAACVAAGRCAKPACQKSRETDWDPERRGEHPVVCVTWEQAKTFCAFAKKRLPTEAEWEKAARGAEGRRYPWGDAPPSCELANYYGCGVKDTLPVGSRPKGASPYGALDMAGNVWEWVADWYHEAYYKMSPAVDPTGPVEGEQKPVRGGAWKYDEKNLDAAGRTFDDPGVRYPHVGVRCASDWPR